MNKTPRAEPKILQGPVVPEAPPAPAVSEPPQQSKDEIHPDIIKHVTTCDEPSLFLFVSSLEGILRRIGNDAKEGLIDRTDVEVMTEVAETVARTSQTLSCAKQATARFGISFEASRIVNRRGQKTSDADKQYQEWYKRWQDYIQGMSADEWDKARAAIEAGEDTSWIKPPAPVEEPA